MSNKEILEKAIAKAIAGGWRGDMLGIEVEEQDNGIVRVYWDNTEWSVLDIVFNHEFAKALWGDEGYTTIGLKCSAQYGVERYWQYQLQQLVIAENPMEYLEKNI